MSHFPQPSSKHRASRVRFGESVSVLVQQQDGRRASGKLQTVSVTGGLLRLARAMQAGDFVEVAFETRSGKVQGIAEMLGPLDMKGCILQPFRFIALADEDHHNLRDMVDLISSREAPRTGARL